MKSIFVNLAAAGAVIATFACGNPSPEVLVSCGTIDDVSATFGTGGGMAIFYIYKFVKVEDEGLSHTTPGRNLNVQVIANAADVDPLLVDASVCGGDLFANCDTPAEYSGTAEVETSDDGFLQYFLLLNGAPGESANNRVSEVIGQTICETNYSFVGAAGP